METTSSKKSESIAKAQGTNVDAFGEYIICPLNIIRGLLNGQRRVPDLLWCGLAYRAMGFSDYDMETAINKFKMARQSEKESIPDEMLWLFGKEEENFRQRYLPLDKIAWDELNSIIEYQMKYNSAGRFPYDMDVWYRCYWTLKELRLPTNRTKTVMEYVALYFDERFMRRQEKQPTFAVSLKVMLDLATNEEKLSEEEHALWAMYFGIMSIIGSKPYIATTSDAIKTRMAGAKSKAELPEVVQDMSEEELQLYEKYTSRYHYGKLMQELQHRNMIAEIGMSRRTYISVKMTLTELVRTAMGRTKRGKDAKLKAQKKAALHNARHYFNTADEYENKPMAIVKYIKKTYNKQS